MDIRFKNPGFEHSINSIMEFQKDDTSAYWNDALFYFFPNLQKELAYSLPLDERKAYITAALEQTYFEKETLINEKVQQYQALWIQHKRQITEAFSDAFEIDCSKVFNDIVCYVTLNPVGPRYLREHYFDLFYLNSDQGALGMSLHELIHYVWFFVWNQVFDDSYDEYETPSLKWILSELVVESIMDDERLSSINPYYPREHGGCIYSYFYTMVLDGIPVTETIRKMYRELRINDFMKEGYCYLQKHEQTIREHIRESEKIWQ